MGVPLPFSFPASGWVPYGRRCFITTASLEGSSCLVLAKTSEQECRRVIDEDAVLISLADRGPGAKRIYPEELLGDTFTVLRDTDENLDARSCDRQKRRALGFVRKPRGGNAGTWWRVGRFIFFLSCGVCGDTLHRDSPFWLRSRPLKVMTYLSIKVCGGTLLRDSPFLNRSHLLTIMRNLSHKAPSISSIGCLSGRLARI